MPKKRTTILLTESRKSGLMREPCDLLLIEDNPSERADLIRAILDDHFPGCRLMIANDVEDGLRQLQCQDPASEIGLILSGLDFSTSVKLVQQIRSDKECRLTPIVILCDGDCAGLKPDIAYRAGANSVVHAGTGEQLQCAMRQLTRFWLRTNRRVPIGGRS